MVEELDTKAERCRVLRAQFNPETYEVDDRWRPGGNTLFDCHSIYEMTRYLEANPSVELEAKVIAWKQKEGKFGFRNLSRTQFLEHIQAKDSKLTFREYDSFACDDFSLNGSPRVGDDFIPLLGGPFNKQLYYYDYLRMHALAFHAYHHDPFAKRTIQMTRDFTLGRGFRVDCDDKKGLALWRAFEEANDLQVFMDNCAIELAIYGEVMVWELPNNQTKIVYQPGQGQSAPVGFLPRFRLIDPSVIWEIVTYPEDITRVLFYQWVAPTQYQIYSGRDQGSSVPGSKFIYQQIPGGEVSHYKVNSVSNEKRGRSDLFSALGYMKRLRDSVNYSIIGSQKASAWAIDTTIEGNQADIDSYVADQAAQGEFAPPGSEFVHTSKVARQYLANQGGNGKGGIGSESFQWSLSMACMATGFPVNYYGTHLSGAQTRASALVATEPVAKLLEGRQLVYERIIKDMAKRLFRQFNIRAEVEVTFPEIAAQDRSAKLKDLTISETQGWISNRTAATIASKELGISEYEYDEEQAQITKDTPEMPDPLGAFGAMPQTPDKQDSMQRPSGITNEDRRQVAQNR